MSKRKLLLADDSITIQKVVNLTFADEGIEVISVGDGDSAMRKFDEFMPDLVMADVNMPGLSGYEVCRIIKRTEETQNIPVILLVGSFEPFDEAEAKDAGADDFLTKPFQSIRQLVNKVTDLLNQRESAPETAADEAENAPVDQFAETLRLETETEAPAESGYQSQEIGSEYGDAGMDDEMIEASPANDYISAAEAAYRADTDFGKTQPLNAEDLKGFDTVPRTSTEQEAPASSENRETETEENEQTPPARAEAASFDEEARKLGYFPAYQPDDRPEISETEPEIDYYLPEGGEEDYKEGEFEKELTDAETLEPEVSYAPEEPREADFSQATVEETAETAETETAETSEPQETPSGFRELEYAEFYKTAEEPEAAAASETEAETAETAEEFQETPERRFDEENRFEAVEEPETVETVEAETAQTPEFESAVSERPETTEATETFETPEIPTEAPVAATTTADVPTFASFDDGDLLELPPLVEETGIRPQPKMPPVAPAEPVAAETSAEPETAETAETAETTETEESPLPIGAAQAFPPELIEAIAQKVAEQISAKTMSDVLPQITELVMKKLAEEKSEDKK